MKHTDSMKGFVVLSTDADLIAKLPLAQQDLITRAGPDVKYRELAEVLQTPEGTIKSRLNRARAKLVKLRAKHTPLAVLNAAAG